MTSIPKFLSGLAAGVAVGFLIAPQRGKKTTDAMLAAIERQTPKLREQLDKAVANVKTETKLAKNNGSNLGEKAENILDRSADQAKNHYNQAVESAADKTHLGIDRTQDALKND